MYDFIVFKLKCPVCNKSLMNSDKSIDNNPSIKLNIEINNKQGTIFLSSVYGSYNYNCDIDTPVDDIATFSCPHCTSKIVSKHNCDSCEAPMVPFNLNMGGRVDICSRSGCQNHYVKFRDFEVVLKKVYQEHGFRGQYYPGTPPEFDNIIESEKKDEHKEIIESGTFLQSYCPHCHKSLIADNKLKLKVANDETGYLYLSPYLNVFTSMSTVILNENERVENLICPHCDESIMVNEKHCDSCESPIAKVLIGARTKMLDFYICSKKGCRWHGLSNEDLNEIRLDDSLEW